MKYLFHISCFLLCFCNCINFAAAQSGEHQEVAERYRVAGQADAVALNQKFQNVDKPKYQQAYDDYLNDLKIIRETGTAADNEGLYSDLRAMNSDDGFVFSETRRGIKNYNRKAF